MLFRKTPNTKNLLVVHETWFFFENVLLKFKIQYFPTAFLIIFEYIKSKRKKKIIIITNGIWRSQNLPNYFRSKKPQKLSYENVKCYVILKNFRSFKNVFENEIGMYSLCNITSFCFNVKIMHIANYSCAISKTLYVSS